MLLIGLSSLEFIRRASGASAHLGFFADMAPISTWSSRDGLGDGIGASFECTAGSCSGTEESCG